MQIKKSSFMGPVKLSEGLAPEVQVLRTGSFNHPTYGKFSITAQILAEMKANFDAKIRGVDIAFDYFHNSDQEAAGWPTDLRLSADGNELWAKVDWTPTAAKKLSDREIRYFSPDFAFQWTDPETGVIYNNVLFGGGLTNRPFVKEMKAIVATEKTEELEMTLEEMKKELADQKAMILKLSAAPPVPPVAAPPAPAGNPDEVAQLKKQLADVTAQLAQSKADSEKMLADKAAADKTAAEAVKMAEKKTEFTKLLSEGKAVAAQEEAFMKDDFKKFIELSEKPNLRGHGDAGGGSAIDDSGTDEENKILKLAETKRKENPKLDFGSSVSLARKELKIVK